MPSFPRCRRSKAISAICTSKRNLLRNWVAAASAVGVLACSRSAQPPTLDTSSGVKPGEARPTSLMIDSVLVGVMAQTSPHQDSVRFRISFKNLRRQEIPLNLSDPYPVVIEVSDEAGHVIWTNVGGTAIQDMLEVGRTLAAGAERVVEVVWYVAPAAERILSSNLQFRALLEADISRYPIRFGPIPLRLDVLHKQ
jgi:hypothetical protein